MLPPPYFALWYPLSDQSGTPTASDETPNGLGVNGIGSITKAAVLGVNAGGASYAATGGVVHAATSAAYWDVIPTGAELAQLQERLDLSGMFEGETIMVGAELIAPAGWAANHTSSNTVFSFGTLSSGSASGGVDFGISSVERPQILVWGADATAQLVVTPTGDFLIDSSRNCVVWEVTCTAENTFKARSHVRHNNGLTSSDWTGALDWSNPDFDGTAAPGCGTACIRIGRRNGTTTNQTNKGETLRNVWVMRLPEETFGVAARACAEMWLTPNQMPRIIRAYSGDATVFTGPDGNANKTFGVIDSDDMFVYLDGATAFTDHPETTIEVEQPASPTITKLSAIASHVQYVTNTDVEALTRVDDSLGPYKLARMKTGAFANSVLFSAHKSDISNRGRSEATWQGPSVSLPYGVDLWTAMRVYFDFDPPDVGQLVFHQLYPGYSGSGLFPPFVLKLDTTNKHIVCEFRWSDQENTLPEDMQLIEQVVPGYGDALFRRWVDIVMLQSINWDESASPFTRIWIDGAQVFERFGPFGYRGPSGQTGKTTAPFTRCGIYPPSPYITPDTKRDFYFKRFFVAKNVGGYTNVQLRDALTASSA